VTIKACNRFRDEGYVRFIYLLHSAAVHVAMRFDLKHSEMRINIAKYSEFGLYIESELISNTYIGIIIRVGA